MALRSSARWQAARRAVLAAHPLCVDPFHVHAVSPALATEVDHIQALRQAPGLALDETNLQGLCRACHARKSGLERRGAMAES